MSYQPIETIPSDCIVSVLTRASNVRTCWSRADGKMFYRNVHGTWFIADNDPPQMWWDGPVPGWRRRPSSPRSPRYYPDPATRRANGE